MQRFLQPQQQWLTGRKTPTSLLTYLQPRELMHQSGSRVGAYQAKNLFQKPQWGWGKWNIKERTRGKFHNGDTRRGNKLKHPPKHEQYTAGTTNCRSMHTSLSCPVTGVSSRYGWAGTACYCSHGPPPLWLFWPWPLHAKTNRRGSESWGAEMF